MIAFSVSVILSLLFFSGYLELVGQSQANLRGFAKTGIVSHCCIVTSVVFQAVFYCYVTSSGLCFSWLCLCVSFYVVLCSGQWCFKKDICVRDNYANFVNSNFIE